MENVWLLAAKEPDISPHGLAEDIRELKGEWTDKNTSKQMLLFPQFSTTKTKDQQSGPSQSNVFMWANLDVSIALVPFCRKYAYK